jgi:hypothetical protein
MPKFVPISQLRASKERLGPIDFLDFRELDLVTAHRKLGEAVKEQAQNILLRKLDRLDKAQFVEGIRLARLGRGALVEKLHAPYIDSRIRRALGEYLDCLSVWTAGAELGRIHHKLLSGLVVDGLPVLAGDLALFLQNDNLGCQTGVYRENGGAVILWHTEEDVQKAGSRFDKPRIATFHTGDGCQMNAFIYPDLLPGPAYCWRSDGFIQAVDSLPLKPAPEAYVLANIATWVTLRLGKTVEPEVVIETLGPFVDGYALTVVQEKGGEVLANKIEFAGDQYLLSSLENEPGCFLFQVNIFSDKEADVAADYEDIHSNHRQTLEGRVTRTSRALRRLTPSDNTTASFFRLLASRLGNDYGYANEDVKSYFTGRISSTEMEIRIGSGPALKGDQLYVIRRKK